MPGRLFLDSNVVIYAVSGDDARRQIAEELLAAAPVVSTQVLGEVATVLRRKWRLEYGEITRILDAAFANATILPITPETVKDALRIGGRHGFSFYDSQIIAAALAAGCTHLFTEDLQHGQVIDALTVRNPFAL